MVKAVDCKSIGISSVGSIPTHSKTKDNWYVAMGSNEVVVFSFFPNWDVC